MPKNFKEKHLLVVSFLEGKNFIKRNNVKFVVEAKFDGEQLATDPVDHNETVEINQELAWELDKKSLHMHRLQRSAIKAICYAVSETGKENIGYVVLDIRSAAEGIGKPKWHNLLQAKYPKAKPALQINLYVEDDQPVQLGVDSANGNDIRPPIPQHKINKTISANSSLNNSCDLKLISNGLKVNLMESEGYFQIDKPTPDCKVYVLTITIAFARNLIRVVADHSSSPAAHFYFVYKFLNNQVTTKPFEDVVSCQINGERSSIRLNTTLDNLKKFFRQENDLEICFCSTDHILAKCALSWKSLLEQWSPSSLKNQENPITIDYLLKFDSIMGNRSSPMIDVSMSPVVGVQVGLTKEKTNLESGSKGFETATNQNIKRESPIPSSSSSLSDAVLQIQQNRNIEQAKEIAVSNLNEELQLKAAYEIEVWKEAREKEFEESLKKKEAKKFQTLAEAFKQHDLERETIVQKKLKDYNGLEIVLKNSLSEVEKREKQLSVSEAQVARLKADLHREYENKLMELREASKRVQEKADHQVQLQRSKCESLEEDISRLKRHVSEWEKKFADKEADFLRYKERENGRPEIRLQSELNMLNLEKLELERKLDVVVKAKNHYKEQWAKALTEIGNIKKMEEENAKAALRKQQMELDHLRLRYLAAEESEIVKSDERQLQSLKNELEKLKINNNRSFSSDDHSSPLNLDFCMDQSLKDHIIRLTEERDTLLRTGVYSNSDAIIVELDKRITQCYKEAKESS